MAGKDLRNEVENYSRTYGQILVGIHNDLVDYKNKVNNYSNKSTEILSKCTRLLNQSEGLKVSTLEAYTKIENHQEAINKLINAHQVSLKEHEIEFEKIIDLLDKYNKDFKNGIDLVEKLREENLDLKKTIETLGETLNKENLNLRGIISTMESSLKKEDLNLKASIVALENKLEDVQMSLLKQENQISNLIIYKIIFIVAFSVLSLLIIIGNLL